MPNFFEEDPYALPDEPAAPAPAPTPIGPQQAQLGPQPFGAALLDAFTGAAPQGTPTPGTPAPAATSSRAGVDVSTRGLTDAGMAKVNQLWGSPSGTDATGRKVDKAMAGRKAELGAVAGMYGEANQQAKDATLEASQAEREYNDGLRALHLREKDFLETQRHVEELAYHQSAQERDHYIAQYQQELAGVRNLMAQNANPMGGMSTTQGLGMGMAMFAQGFLAARGINIDVGSQIDKWVDRELQQHQQKIQNQSAMAQQQLTLLDIARQSSRDDAEARQKLRGFAIEGFKVEVQAQADKFNSDIGRAKAKATIAGLNKELAGVVERLGTQFHQERLAMHNSIVKENAAMGNLAIQSQKLKLDEARANRLEQAAQNKAQQEKLSELRGRALYDTSTGGKGSLRWFIKDGLKPTDKPVLEYKDAQSNLNSLQKDLTELRGLQQQFKTTALLDRGRFSEVHTARIQELTSRVLSKYARSISGLAVTEQEIQRLKALVPDRMWEPTSGEDKKQAARLDAILAGTYEGWTQDVDAKRYEIADALTPEEVEAAGKIGIKQTTDYTSHFNEAGVAEARSSKNGPPDDDTPVNRAQQAVSLESPGSRERVSDGDLKTLKVEDAPALWEEFNDTLKKYPGDTRKHTPDPSRPNDLPTAMITNPLVGNNLGFIIDHFGGEKGIPQYAAGIVALAKTVKAGGDGVKQAKATLEGLLQPPNADQALDPHHQAAAAFASHLNLRMRLHLKDPHIAPQAPSGDAARVVQEAKQREAAEQQVRDEWNQLVNPKR